MQTTEICFVLRKVREFTNPFPFCFVNDRAMIDRWFTAMERSEKIKVKIRDFERSRKI